MRKSCSKINSTSSSTKHFVIQISQPLDMGQQMDEYNVQYLFFFKSAKDIQKKRDE